MTSLKYDRQIDGLVFQLLPNVVKRDRDLEKSFWNNRGVDIELLEKKSKQKSEDNTVEKESEEKKVEALHTEELSFKLVPDSNEKNLNGLLRPFIRTSSTVTVLQIKKYLKLKLNKEINDLEISYRNNKLGNEHTLEFIYKQNNLDQTPKLPIFIYSMKNFSF